MYEIMAHEIRYINQDKPHVSVLFQLPSHDWEKLKVSNEWQQIEELLQEMKMNGGEKNAR